MRGYSDVIQTSINYGLDRYNTHIKEDSFHKAMSPSDCETKFVQPPWN